MTHPVPQAALDKHIAILGKTGSGKSNLAKTIAEDLLARGRRVCVIDPTGTWWGMRLMADGQTPSQYPIVIFGGQHADLPVAAAHGPHIARAIGASSTPAIVDTREMTVGDRTTFFTGFAETLIRENRGELALIVDEAHLFMPQSGGRAGGAAPAMLHAANNLVSLGRGVGLRIVLISQRPAKLHKDSLTQVETLVAMRLVAPQDRRAIDDWMGAWADPSDGVEIAHSLPGLKTGEAWVWSPEIGHLALARCPLAATWDSGRVRDGETPGLPRIDVAEIAGQLEKIGSDLLADDPKRLRARIRELERALKKKPATVDEAAVERRVTQDVAAKYSRLYSDAARTIGGVIADAEALARRLDDIRGTLGAAAAEPEGASKPPTPVGSPPQGASNGHGAASRVSSTGLTGPQQRVLDALAWLAELGIAERASRIQVAFLAGYKPGGGAFNNTLGQLRSARLISYPSSGEVTLTGEGHRLAQPWGSPLTDAALQEAVMARLTGPQRRVLQPLIDRYPLDMGSDELADEAGYEAGGGAFNNTRGSLRSLGLIDYPGRGRVVAQPVLFVEGAA